MPVDPNIGREKGGTNHADGPYWNQQFLAEDAFRVCLAAGILSSLCRVREYEKRRLWYPMSTGLRSPRGLARQVQQKKQWKERQCSVDRPKLYDAAPLRRVYQSNLHMGNVRTYVVSAQGWVRDRSEKTVLIYAPSQTSLTLVAET